MPVEHKLPIWEGEDNRKKIFHVLWRRSLTFIDLYYETGFSRSTLSSHLKELQKENVIEKAVENGKIVYRTTLNEERLVSELKRSTYDVLVSLLSQIDPFIGKTIEMYLKVLVKFWIWANKKVVEGGPQSLEAEECLRKMIELLESESPDYLPKKAIEELKRPSKETLDRFKELMNTRANIEQYRDLLRNWKVEKS
jgi:DNA-binding transcriptional ArsR family regulator